MFEFLHNRASQYFRSISEHTMGTGSNSQSYVAFLGGIGKTQLFCVRSSVHVVFYSADFYFIAAILTN